jgi:rod shape-determining protein MreD
MNTTFLYFYSLSLLFILSSFFPNSGLFYFAPMMILSFYKHSLPACLWWGLVCGLTIDLFASETKLGFYALNYCLATLILYRYKYQFFEDSLSTLPIMTFIFGFCTTLISTILYSAVITPIPLSLKWLYHDLLWLPINDAIYAAMAFTLPLQWIKQKRYFTFLFGRR